MLERVRGQSDRYSNEHVILLHVLSSLMSWMLFVLAGQMEER